MNDQLNNGMQLSVLAGVLANAIAANKTADEINIIGNFLTAMAACLLTIAAAETTNTTGNNTTNNMTLIDTQIVH
jgi:hypothetical protein